MRFLISFVAFWLTITQGVHSSPAPAPTQVLDQRAACNQDNLLNALKPTGHLSDSYAFCSAYISIPPTSTVAVYTTTSVLSTHAIAYQTIHPLYLFNLQRYSYGTATPISYNSASPSPSSVPGGPLNYYPGGVSPYGRKRQAYPAPPAHDIARRAGTALPTYIANTYPASRLSSACSCLSVPAAATTTISTYFYSQQTTTTCTFYEPLPTATYPAFCAPSDQVNVVAPASHSGYQVVPNFSAPSKMDCCAACASVFNCVWWKFDFGTSGDGWAPGICHYAYYTGNNQNTDGNQPAICPNGATQGIPFGANPPADREESNNQPGCNFGPCGNAYDVFQSSQDFGYPDDYYFHQCSP